MKFSMLITSFIVASILFGISCEAESQLAINLSVVAMAIPVITVIILSKKDTVSHNNITRAV